MHLLREEIKAQTMSFLPRPKMWPWLFSSSIALTSPMLTDCMWRPQKYEPSKAITCTQGGTVVTELGLLCTLFIFLQSQTPSFLSSFLWSLGYSPAHSSFSLFTSWLWIPAIMSVIYFNILAKHFLTHTLVRLIYTLQVESCVSQDSLFPRRRISISPEGPYSRDPTLLLSQH